MKTSKLALLLAGTCLFAGAANATLTAPGTSGTKNTSGTVHVINAYYNAVSQVPSLTAKEVAKATAGAGTMAKTDLVVWTFDTELNHSYKLGSVTLNGVVSTDYVAAFGTTASLDNAIDTGNQWTNGVAANQAAVHLVKNNSVSLPAGVSQFSVQVTDYSV